MSINYDVAVIGVGAVGSAALYQLSKLGLKALGIDSFSPPHEYGSSGGETRIVRQAIGEGEHYVPLALQSYDIWEELRQLTGQKLVHKIGGLILAPPQDPFFATTLLAAKKYQIKHVLLSAQEIRKKFPEFKIDNNIMGYYEYDAGYVIPENCIDVQIQQARQNGAVLKFNEEVLDIAYSEGEIIITTNKEKYHAKKALIAVGSWVNKFLSFLSAPKRSGIFTVYRQVLYWFDILNKNYFDPTRFPVFIWRLPTEGGIYGFPAVGGPFAGIKLATHNMTVARAPERLNRVVSKAEQDDFYKRFVKPYFPTLGQTCLKSMVCTYTTTPDENFVIDFLPDCKNMLLVSACSGHGFKHSAAVGKLAAQCLTGADDLGVYSCFSLARFK